MTGRSSRRSGGRHSRAATGSPTGGGDGKGMAQLCGVAVGSVFGAGDYQRKGRFEMSESGFHVGHVQPEWLDPSGAGCWSLVLNNDKGQSNFGSFDTVTYAGAGGRNRGQNRTAAQSYDQR